MGKTDRTTTALRPAQLGHRRVDARNADRTTVTWFTWRHLRCKVLETPHWGVHGSTFLRLDIIAPRDTPVPITTTGSLAHGIAPDELAAAGGAVAFLTAWMDREAKGKAYQRAEFLWRQGDLLDPLALDDDREA